MPLPFSLGVHKSLKSISDRLLNSEKCFAFLDDIYLVCRPNRVAAVYEAGVAQAHQHRHLLWEDQDLESQRREAQWSRPLDGGSTSAGPTRDCVEGRLEDPSSEPSVKVLGVPVGSTLCFNGFRWPQTSMPVGCQFLFAQRERSTAKEGGAKKEGSEGWGPAGWRPAGWGLEG